MNELDIGMSSEQLKERLFQSIEMVKTFRKVMRDALYFIKRNYNVYSYLHEFIGSDYFTEVTSRVKCELQLDLTTKKLTMVSLIDPDLRESTTLLNEQQWLDFIERELIKEGRLNGK